MDPHHVVVVDDDSVTRAKLSGYMEAAGHRVSEVGDGKEMFALLERDEADLILLDVNLPGEDGLDLARHLRERSSVGIILVTGRADDIDIIVGLEMGADDYVTKPFNPRELLARVKALLRRMDTTRGIDQPVKRFAGFSFDTRTRQLRGVDGRVLSLTRAEFELLSTFVTYPGEVMSRDRLLARITHRTWDPSDRTIDVLVRRLRQKIESDPRHPEMIVTAHGEGYVFAVGIADA